MVKSRQTLRVALVDADENAHRAIKSEFIENGKDWQLDAYSCARRALVDIPAFPPQVVLMEASLPGVSSMDYVRKLRLQIPEVPVVMWGSKADPGTLLNAMTTGASGYLLKPLPPGDLTMRLNKVLTGGMTLCQQSEKLLLEGLRDIGRWNSASPLTRREQEIMLNLGRQSSDKEIAMALGIAKATVHAHLAKIFKKLEVHDREAALRKLSEMRAGGIAAATGS
jgi:DNA-binding NarL/FixJ family response regulator